MVPTFEGGEDFEGAILLLHADHTLGDASVTAV